MSFFKPEAWWWAALALLVVLVYVFHLGRQRQPVATFFLWQRALARRPAWFAIRYWASLATQVLVVLWLVAALAQPYWTALFAARRTIALVLDVSASMCASDVEPTRYEQMLTEAQTLVRSLRRGERMAIVTAGTVLQTVCRLTDDREALLAALEAIPPTDGTTEIPAAVELARQLLASQRNPHIVVLTDGCFPEAPALAQAEDVHLIRIAARGRNVGITRLQTRPQPNNPAQCEVLVAVANFSTERQPRTLEVGLHGAPPQAAPVDLPAAGTWQQVFSLPAPRGGLLVARLRPQAPAGGGRGPADDLPSDDIAFVSVPARSRPRVTLVGQGADALTAVLQGDPRIELHTVAELPSPPPADGLTIYFRQVPAALPAGPALVIEPPTACDLWDAGEVLREGPCAVQAAQADTPLLSGVDFANYVVDEAVRLQFKQPAETLVTARSGDPLYSALERPTGRVLVLAVNLEKSDLPLRTDFPRLLDNALRWLSPIRDDDPAPPATGDVVSFPAADAARWLAAPDGWQAPLAAQQTLAVLDRVGVWNIGTDRVRRAPAPPRPGATAITPPPAAAPPARFFPSSLLNAGESDLSPAADVRSEEFPASPVTSDEPLWMWLVGLAGLLMVIEWCLFHRRVVV